MRQAPHYLIIGSGRLATHFKHYFSLLNLSFATWSRQANSQQQLLDSCDSASHILFLISDYIIPQFTQPFIKLPNKTLIHCSGALVLNNVYSAHPPMPFSEKLYDLDFYQKIPFILETDGPEFSKLFPGLSNPAYKIPTAAKAYYHALCVLSGNFTTILWQKFFHELETRFNLPKTVGFSYLEGTTKNLLMNPDAAFTGPLARKDYPTILANLHALKDDSFREIYQAFLTLFGITEEHLQ